MKSLEWIKADGAARLLEVKRRPGRPPRASKPSLKRIEIRCTAAERKAWRRAAKSCSQTLSDWLRSCAADWLHNRDRPR